MTALKFIVIVLFFSFPIRLGGIKCYNCSSWECVNNTTRVDCEDDYQCFTGYEDYYLKRGCVKGQCTLSRCDSCSTNLCNKQQLLIDEPLKCYDCDPGPCANPQTITCTRKTDVCVTAYANNSLQRGCQTRSHACLDEEDRPLKDCKQCDTDLCNNEKEPNNKDKNRGERFLHNIFLCATAMTLILLT